MKRRDFLRAAAASAIAACAPTPPTTATTGELVAAMSLERKVGQLMSVAFHGTRITSSLEATIRERGIGGLILYSENFADAQSLAKLVADLDRIARDAKSLPLFFEIDQEGGPVIRIGRGATILPGQMALAATADPERSVRTAASISAAELRALGVNWNFAPVADVNDEPTNPIISNRSFSSDPVRVSSLVSAAVQAYAAAGFFCCAKHFPGHGSTTTDSHTGLPKIDVDRSTIDRVELAPFRAAIAAGVPAIMSAHIVVPALDATPELPVTLSRAVMTDLLRGTLGFDGLVVTDDLEMGALKSIGEAAAGLRALQAGADYLLFRFDESAQLEGHRLIADAVRSGSLSSARLEQSVRRVVDAKRRFGILDGRRDQSAPDLAANARTALDLARGATTLLRNRGVLPLRGRILAVSPTNADISFFEGQPTLGSVIAAKRADAVSESLPLHPSGSEIDRVVSASRAADVVVVGTTNLFAYPEQIELVNALAREKPVAVVALRGPYDILSVPEIPAYLCAYDSREPSLIAAAEILLGERKPSGSLPAVIPGVFSLGAGMRDFA
ncbi:MAG: glycoside hydrolase family 3 protein [Chloroflexi bacterium]|nr:MAG: glycoside hydrolase family 3 protein [Chloroflexota bacterium]